MQAGRAVDLQERRRKFWFRLTKVNLAQTSGSLIPGGLLPVYLNSIIWEKVSQCNTIPGA